MKDVIQSKLQSFNCQSSEEEENALKEITQEVALYALQKTGFFQEARFQGGTCLRIIHGLDRFSEDLDFALATPNLDFNLESYLQPAAKIMASYGYNMEVSGKDRASNVLSRFLKDDSIKKLINFHHYANDRSKVRIKVEIDINPSAGAVDQVAYVDFPTDFNISAHDLPSLFAGKCHALICRDYTKGRDWYDFSWYVSKGIKPNITLLSSALFQTGPWQGKAIDLSDMLEGILLARIKEIDWKEAARDVARCLKPDKRETTSLWSEAFFTSKLEKMSRQK